MRNRIDIIYNIILKPIKENILFFTFIYILGISTTIIECIVLGYKFPKFNIFSCLFDLYAILAITTIIKSRKFRNIILVILAILLYSISIINTFCVEIFHAKIGPEILNVILETNQREASEFIDKYINSKILLSYTAIIVVIALFHIYSTFKKQTLFCKIQFNNLTKDTYIFILKTISILFIVGSCILCFQSRYNIIQLVNAKTVSEADKYIDNYSQNNPLNNLIFAVKMRILANESLTDLIKTQQNTQIDNCDFLSPNIILIIGESYIRCHSQLYGYPLNTTPEQKKWEKGNNEGQMIIFNDVISPHNLTSSVFKNIFSLKSIDDTNEWASYPLFPALFKKAGYNVTFITNQFVESLNTDIFNFSGGLFLNEKELSKVQFCHRNTQAHQYDEGLLQDYDSLQQFNKKNNLIIFHLAGQHIDFYKRSPQNWKKFHPKHYEHRKDLNNSEKQLVADYDNATLYNDHILGSIINRFIGCDAIIIHFPDHGEECYDGLHRMGRIPGDNYQPEVLRQEYQIPFWIWVSKEYNKNHPEVVSRIINAKNKPYMTDDISHMLLYLSGIKCKEYVEQKNLLSNSYNKNRHRLINGKIDFDMIVNK